jgi:hypothetical protein
MAGLRRVLRTDIEGIVKHRLRHPTGFGLGGGEPGLQKFWIGYADESMGDLYDKMNEDVEFRTEWAGRCGFGFKLPSVVPNVPKIGEKSFNAIGA